MELNNEIRAKAKAAKTPEELIEIAKENDVEMTEESAKAYFDLLHPKTGEMSDDELDNVSGGGCRGNDDRMVTTLMSDCEHWKCKKDGSSAPTGSPGYLTFLKCPKCKCIVRCSNCPYCTYEKGLWLCNHPANRGK